MPAAEVYSQPLAGISAGVSVSLWFPKQWRLTLDYEHGTVEGRAPATDRRERALMARAAIAF